MPNLPPTSASSLLEAAACFECIPTGAQRQVAILSLLRWANGACTPPPDFTLTGWTVSPTSLTMHLDWTCLPSNPIARFEILYGTAGPAGPFTDNLTLTTGITCPAQGPFVSNPADPTFTGLNPTTFYFFQVTAISADGCRGASSFFNQSTN